jgi:hypothetical protein
MKLLNFLALYLLLLSLILEKDFLNSFINIHITAMPIRKLTILPTVGL